MYQFVQAIGNSNPVILMHYYITVLGAEGRTCSHVQWVFFSMPAEMTICQIKVGFFLRLRIFVIIKLTKAWGINKLYL